MNDPEVKGEQIPDSLVATICERLGKGKRVRRTLHDGARLHIDRPLPFLCVHRQPVDADDDGTGQLLEGEASFLTVTASKRTKKSVSTLVTELAQEMASRYGAFLILEIWSAPDADVEDAAQTDDIEPTELKPDFVVIPRGTSAPHRTTNTLCRHLKRVSYLKQPASVRVDTAAPHILPALLIWSRLTRLNDFKWKRSDCRFALSTVTIPRARYFLKCSEHFSEVLGGH